MNTIELTKIRAISPLHRRAVLYSSLTDAIELVMTGQVLSGVREHPVAYGDVNRAASDIATDIINMANGKGVRLPGNNSSWVKFHVFQIIAKHVVPSYPSEIRTIADAVMEAADIIYEEAMQRETWK